MSIFTTVRRAAIAIVPVLFITTTASVTWAIMANTHAETFHAQTKAVQANRVANSVHGKRVGTGEKPVITPTAQQLTELIEASKPYRKSHSHQSYRNYQATSDVDDHLTSGGALLPLEAFYDVRSYEINLKVDPATKTIDGFTDITVITNSPQNKIQFDLVNTYKISSVKIIERPNATNSDEPQNYTHLKNSIVIDSDLTALGKYKFRIAYSGQPIVAVSPPWVGGFTWAVTEQNKPWVGLSCEGEGGKIWFPAKDHPSDEAEEVTLKISAPKGLYVAANGVLTAIDETDPNWSTYTWKTSYSISTYAINFTIGDFDLTKGEHDFEGVTTPVIFYGLKDTQSTDYIEGDHRTLQERKSDLVNYGIQYLDFFSRNFGPFAFSSEKMAYVHTPYYGMEHQTAIAYGAGFKAQYTMDYIAFHELAHEWWGNKVTAKDWADVWIHESFASYSEALYFEQKFDNPTYWKFLNAAKAGMGNLKPIVGPPDSNTDQLDVGDIYYKGANILAIFRELVGRQLFLDILKSFAAVPPGSSGKLVTTDDFYKLIEEKTGKSYRWFFDPYLKRAELPLLKSKMDGELLTLTWAMAEPFPLPLTVDFIDKGKRTRITLPMTNNTGTVNVGSGENLQIGKMFSRMFRLEKE